MIIGVSICAVAGRRREAVLRGAVGRASGRLVRVLSHWAMAARSRPLMRNRPPSVQTSSPATAAIAASGCHIARISLGARGGADADYSGIVEAAKT